MVTKSGAELIELSLFEDRRRPRRGDATGEILLFTGVRYERIVDEPTEAERRFQEAL